MKDICTIIKMSLLRLEMTAQVQCLRLCAPLFSVCTAFKHHGNQPQHADKAISDSQTGFLIRTVGHP